MVRLENAQTTPDVHKGSVDLAKIAAGEAVTILVRDLQLHLAPNNQSTYTFSFNPFDPGDPCGTTLCYVTPTANVLEFYQIGNCWITTGPPVYVVTLTYAEPCFR